MLSLHNFNSLCLLHHIHFLCLPPCLCRFCSISKPQFHRRKKQALTLVHTHIHCNTQLRHQSLRWPSFRLEPYLKLKLCPPQNAVAAPFCLLIIVLKRHGIAMLFQMGSPCYCQPYRRSVPHVMELRVD